MPRGGARRNAGRPKDSENKKHRALRTGLEPYVAKAIKTILALMESGNERIALEASTYIVDQVHGRPRQAVEVGGSEVPIQHKVEITIVR